MKTSKTVLLCLLVLLVLLALLCGCKSSTEGPDDPGAEPQQTEATRRDYGNIGTMDGIQYDEKHGNLISPYTRCQISLEGEDQSFGYYDGEGKCVRADAEQLTTVFGESDAAVTADLDEGSIETAFRSLPDGSLEISQKLHVPDGGISGVEFVVKVPIQYSLIIPAWDGICLNEKHPEIYDKRTYLPYPREWQAQMLLVQGQNGGVLIQAKDDGTQFKGLEIRNDGEYFYLGLRSVPQAPFTDYEDFSTVSWSVTPYEGGWQNGANLYKDYMNEAFRLDELNERQPDWAKEIQLVWMDDLDSKEKLQLLANEVDPQKTLIQIGGWRRADYDTEYPDYTPKDGMVELIRFARSLGFHVSLHCNMLGCAFDAPEWEEGIKDVACLDAYSQEVIVEGYTAFGKDYRFGQINQAAAVWQDLMVDRMTKLVAETGADCIHLDQSLICFNDGRGYIDGMTTMQGNVELQRKLAEALPGIAFSGEGTNEYNMRYADFLQQHVYGLDSNAKTWSNGYFEQIVPLTTYLFYEYARPYHYPALPTADEKNRDYYLAWFRAGDAMSGHIPCLYRESVVSLTEPSEVFTKILDEARFYMKTQPVMNPGEWGEGAVISYLLNDGTVAEWRVTEQDLSFYPDASKEEATTVFVQGVDSYKTDRELHGWILYDENALKGLRLDGSYLLSDTPRDDNASHITEMEENITTLGFYASKEYTAVSLEEIVPSNKRVVSFTDYGGEMRGGEVLYSGEHNETPTFSSQQSFWFTLPQQGQVRHMGDRIMFHPPWYDEVDAIGYTWLEVDVPLETYGNARFEASFQLATAESAAGSDGVIFKVAAWEKDGDKSDMVSDEVTCLSEIALPVNLDLTAFEGKTVTVRVECYTGPTPRNDSCHMVSPQVVQDKGNVERLVSYTVKTAQPVRALISLSGEAAYESVGGDQYRITADIGDTVWLVHDIGTVRNEEDMTVYPFLSAWKMDSGETVSPTGDFKPRQMVIESNYELRNGIFQHPPQNGVSLVSFLVKLPDSGKPHFDAAIAMRKGSIQSDGVRFSVLVNGTEIFAREKAGASGFEDISVDLSEYRGATIVLTLRTDSGESSAYDYAFWGDPLLYTK